MYLLLINAILGLCLIVVFIVSIVIARRFSLKSESYIIAKRVLIFFISFIILFCFSSALVRQFFLGDRYVSEDSKIYNYYQQKELYIEPEALDRHCNSSILTENSAYFYGNWQITDKEAKLVCKKGVDNYGSMSIKSIDSKERSLPYYYKKKYENNKEYKSIYNKDNFFIYEKKIKNHFQKTHKNILFILIMVM